MLTVNVHRVIIQSGGDLLLVYVPDEKPGVRQSVIVIRYRREDTGFFINCGPDRINQNFRIKVFVSPVPPPKRVNVYTRPEPVVAVLNEEVLGSTYVNTNNLIFSQDTRYQIHIGGWPNRSRGFPTGINTAPRIKWCWDDSTTIIGALIHESENTCTTFAGFSIPQRR